MSFDVCARGAGGELRPDYYEQWVKRPWITTGVVPFRALRVDVGTPRRGGPVMNIILLFFVA